MDMIPVNSMRGNSRKVHTQFSPPILKMFGLLFVFIWIGSTAAVVDVGFSLFKTEKRMFGSRETIVQISSGGYHTMMLHSNGKVYGVGRNNFGQLGDGTNDDRWIPVAMDTTGVLNGKTIDQISRGIYHTMMLDSNGKVYGVGRNNYGQLGDGTNDNRNTPVAMDTTGVLNGKTITQISGGERHTALLDSNGKVYTVGNNGNGQLGDGTNGNRLTPVAMDTTGALNGITITQISSGWFHTMMLDSNGKMYGVGLNGNGQLGIGSTQNRNIPVAMDTTGVLNGITITQISATGWHTMMLDSNGKVYGVGYNLFGQLGIGSTQNRNFPVAMDTTGALHGKTITQISSGTSHTMMLDSNGKVYTVGNNRNGQLGDGTTENRLTPVAMNTTGALHGKIIAQISSGRLRKMMLDSNGIVYGVGMNNYGQLGDGTNDDRWIPVAMNMTGVWTMNQLSDASMNGMGNGTIFPVHVHVENVFELNMLAEEVEVSFAWSNDNLPRSYFEDFLVRIPAYSLPYSAQTYMFRVSLKHQNQEYDYYFGIRVILRALQPRVNGNRIFFSIPHGESITLDASSSNDPDNVVNYQQWYQGESFQWLCFDYITSGSCGFPTAHGDHFVIPSNLPVGVYLFRLLYRVSMDEPMSTRSSVRSLIVDVSAPKERVNIPGPNNNPERKESIQSVLNDINLDDANDNPDKAIDKLLQASKTLNDVEWIEVQSDELCSVCSSHGVCNQDQFSRGDCSCSTESCQCMQGYTGSDCSIFDEENMNVEQELREGILNAISSLPTSNCNSLNGKLSIFHDLSLETSEMTIMLQEMIAQSIHDTLSTTSVGLCEKMNANLVLMTITNLLIGYFGIQEKIADGMPVEDLKMLLSNVNDKIHLSLDQLQWMYAESFDPEMENIETSLIHSWVTKSIDPNLSPLIVHSNEKKLVHDEAVFYHFEFVKNPFLYPMNDRFEPVSNVSRFQYHYQNQTRKPLYNAKIRLSGDNFDESKHYQCWYFHESGWNASDCSIEYESSSSLYCHCSLLLNVPYAAIEIHPEDSKNYVPLIVLLSIGGFLIGGFCCLLLLICFMLSIIACEFVIMYAWRTRSRIGVQHVKEKHRVTPNHGDFDEIPRFIGDDRNDNPSSPSISSSNMSTDNLEWS